MNRRRIAGVTLLLVLLGVVLPGSGVYPAPVTETPPEFSTTKAMSRKHIKDGKEIPAGDYNVKVSVSKTTDLRSGQQVEVSWSGAHPTLATADNPGAAGAPLQEYPVVLIECRGVDTPTKPLDPTTCWTATTGARQYDDQSIAFPPWRLDRYETAAHRRAQVDAPPIPAGCGATVANPSRLVPFVGPDPDNKLYYPLNGVRENDTCGLVLAPDMVNVEDPDAPPSNTTFAATNADGTGSAKFVVTTDEQNRSLGCSMTVLCTLVVLPIIGISCDLDAKDLPAQDRPTQDDLGLADPRCRANGRYAPGTRVPMDRDGVDVAVSGAFWWSASNWNNRISVPITFGPPSNLCDLTDNRQALDILGSELMAEATAQWSTAFCTDPNRFKFRHVRLGEPQAKSALVASGAEAALVSQPPAAPYPIPVVSAPVAVSGFAISYRIDDANGKEYKDLKLNARLLAKLLTESYPTRGDLRTAYGKAAGDNEAYQALAGNPLGITLDPEFKALNPTVGDSFDNIANGSTLLALSGNSDVMYALSAYINADPEARAWLNGEQDPWGMVVNPGYKGLPLPLPSWPLLDKFISDDYPTYSVCGQVDPALERTLPKIPYLPLLASPLPSLTNISQRVQFALSNAHVNCKIQLKNGQEQVNLTMAAWGRQSLGSRFMLGLTSLGDAKFLDLDTAALQTHSTVDKAARFDSPAGRTFVEPTDDSMKAAMAFAKPDAATNTWLMDYGKMASEKGAGAYPGTMPIFVTVPTSGLPEGDGPRLAQLVRFAAADGQTPGLDSGQLPPGYLPMTAANGMGDLVAYALVAADAMQAQAGAVPQVVPGAVTTTTPPANNNSNNNGGSGTTTNPAATGSVPAAGSRPSAAASASASAAAPVPKSAGFTARLSSVLAAWALPIAVLIALGTFLIGSVVRAVTYVVTWWRAT